MNWKISFSSEDERVLMVGLAILIGLLFIAAVRILLLLRKVRKMAERADKLEKQILDQQRMILDVRSDANAWRGEMQRQFDAYRADASRWHVEEVQITS